MQDRVIVAGKEWHRTCWLQSAQQMSSTNQNNSSVQKQDAPPATVETSATSNTSNSQAEEVKKSEPRSTKVVMYNYNPNNYHSLVCHFVNY
jgi:hypothetical protein